MELEISSEAKDTTLLPLSPFAGFPTHLDGTNSDENHADRSLETGAGAYGAAIEQSVKATPIGMVDVGA